jgi:hypothetical protein
MSTFAPTTRAVHWLLPAAVAAAAALAWPTPSHGQVEPPAPFSIADIFFEFNATANDLGAHVFLDAESWKEVRIEGPGARRMMTVSPQGGFRRIGLSELFFEGDEPSLDEVPFEEFIRRVPLGRYVFTGVTTEDEQLRSTDVLNDTIPCAVDITSPAEDAEVAFNRLVVRWRPAPGVYDPEEGVCEIEDDEEIDLVAYQVIVAAINEETGEKRELLATLPADATAFPVPAVMLREAAATPGTEFQIEVLAIEASGNKTITERGFDVVAP